MKKCEAHVESNGAGWYSVYCNENFPFGVLGEGATIEEAERDFLAVFNEMRTNYKERTGENVEATFTFVKDISAVLQECKAYISFAYLAQITGISKVMLSQYACGTRKPKAAQRERIVGGIHQIGQTCLQIGVN
jgi:hypothetical protein